jgi:hypothetical protein
MADSKLLPSLPSSASDNCFSIATQPSSVVKDVLRCIIITNVRPPSDLRSSDPTPKTVLGNKAVGGVDADKDHLPNVVSGLKG